MDSIEDNKRLAHKFLDAMAALDLDALQSLVAPDFIIDSKGSSPFSGPRPLSDLPLLIKGMQASLKGGRASLEILSVTADDSRVACEARGDAMTVTGKPYRNQYLFLLEMKNGKVTKCSEYMDTRLMDELIVPIVQRIMAGNA